jgi:hypothetical protein
VAYESKGKCAGQIQIDLPGYNVPRDEWNGLEKAIARFKNVVCARISPHGWLTADTDLANFKSGEDLSSVLAEVETRIIKACRARVPA